MPMLRHPIRDPHRTRDCVVEHLTGGLDHPAVVRCLGGIGRCGSPGHLSEQSLRSLRAGEMNPEGKSLPCHIAPAATGGETTQSPNRLSERDRLHCHISQSQKLNPVPMTVHPKRYTHPGPATV